MSTAGETRSENLGPRIVALETSGRAGSVAVALGGRIVAVRELSAARRHAVELMPALQELTREAGWAANSIEQIYLSAGPGSFTGLRIAVALARAMHQATGCQLMAIPSLDVIAQNAPGEVTDLVVVLDAKRGQVFGARYQRAVGGESDAAGMLVRRSEPALTDPAGLVRAALAEAGGRKVHITGEGVEYHRPALLSGGDESRIVELDRALWTGRAAVVHALGWAEFQGRGAGAFADPGTLLPIYIRLPEAEELWRKRRGLAV